MPAALRPVADAMLPHYGDDVPVQIFSKGWAIREKGVGAMNAAMSKVLSKPIAEQGNAATLMAITECLKDKVQQVLVKAIESVHKYAAGAKGNKEISFKTDSGALEKMMA